MSKLQGIEISLKPIAGGINRVLPPGINQVMQQEYANKYLESIGAYPTRENIEFVLNNLAIKDALVMPVWARSKIVIVPGMAEKASDSGFNMNDILSENKDKEKKNRTRKKKAPSAKPKDAEVDLRSLADEAHEATMRGRKLSWATVHTLDLLEPLSHLALQDRTIAHTFEALLRPPALQAEDLQRAVALFITSLGDYLPRVKHDFQLFKSIRRLLKSPGCMQLYGLLVHFCYWTLLRPAAKQALQGTRGGEFEMVDLDRGSEERYSTNLKRMHDPEGRGTRMGAGGVGGVGGGGVGGEMGGEHIDLNLPRDRSAVGLERMFHEGLLAAEDTGTATDDYSPRSGSPGSPHSPYSPHSPRSPGSPNRPLSPASLKGWGMGESPPATGTRIGTTTTTADDMGNMGVGAKGGRRVGFDLHGNAAWDGVGDWEKNGEGDVSALGETSLATDATDASLSLAEREHLFMQLETCIMSLFRRVGRRRADLVTGRQALVTCCHFVIDDCLTSLYPWFSGLPDKDALERKRALAKAAARMGGMGTQGKDDSRPGTADTNVTNESAPFLVDHTEESARLLNLRLRRLVHQGLSDIVDPARLYTSAMLMTNLTGKVETKNINSKGKCRFFTTSVATKALLGDTTSEKARRFLENGRGLYSVVPGAVEPYHIRHGGSRGMQGLGGAGGVGLSAQQQRLREVLADVEAVEGALEAAEKQAARDGEQQALLRGWRAAQKAAGAGAGGGPGVSRPSSSGGFGTLSGQSSRRHSEAGGAWDKGRDGYGEGARGGFVSPSLQHTPLAPSSSSRGGSGSADPNREHRRKAHKPLDFTCLFPDPKASPQSPTRPGTGGGLLGGFSSGKGFGFSAMDFSGKGFSGKGNGSARGAGGAGGRDADILDLRDRSRSPSPILGLIRGSTPQPPPPLSPEQARMQERSRFSPARPASTGVGAVAYGSLTEQRSLAYNKAAAVPLTLSAKSQLMSLMVDKTSAIYGTQMQTRIITERVGLIRPASKKGK